MGTNSTQEKGTLTTLYATLAGGNSKVKMVIVPQIQRDYAQGRISASKIRNKFLNALFKAIDSPADECDPIELDFVYGSKKEFNGFIDFYPIDGQQRITTLYLLHLFLGKRLGKDCTILKRFSYQTRDSSRQFCEHLCKLEPNIKTSYSAYIKDKYWCTNTWLSDPTIAGMLVTLEDIYQHYKNFSDEKLEVVWQNLIGNENKLGNIRFYRLYLDEIDTTDDLYIKMNSRGKQLTDFEHFKSVLESYTRSNGEFSLKVDTSWTMLIWKYRDTRNDENPDKYGQNGLDQRFLNIFKHYMAIEATKMDICTYKQAYQYDELALAEMTFGKYESIIGDFIKVMDYLASYKDVSGYFDKFITLEECSSDRVYIGDELGTAKTDYLKACSESVDNFSIRKTLMLEAFLEFARIQPEESETEEYIDRFRIVRNLCRNSKDDLRDDKMHILLRRVDEIMRNKDLAVDERDFTIVQKKQEVKKLKWLSEAPENKKEEYRKTLFCVENHGALYGNLKPLEIEGETYDLTMMSKFIQVIPQSLTDYDIIERALLTIGDYSYRISDREHYGGKHKNNWLNDIFVNGNSNTPPILQGLLKSGKVNSINDLDGLIEAYVKESKDSHVFTWRYYMIVHRGMRHGESAKYYRGNTSDRYQYVMMNKTQFNGLHWNPFLYCLSKKIAQSKINDYGGALSLLKHNVEIECFENYYKVSLSNKSEYVIHIPQIEGVDSVDRISLFDSINECIDIPSFIEVLRVNIPEIQIESNIVS